MMDLFDHDRLLELSLLYRRRGFLKLLPKGFLHWIFVSNALNSKMGDISVQRTEHAAFIYHIKK